MSAKMLHWIFILFTIFSIWSSCNLCGNKARNHLFDSPRILESNAISSSVQSYGKCRTNVLTNRVTNFLLFFFFSINVIKKLCHLLIGFLFPQKFRTKTSLAHFLLFFVYIMNSYIPTIYFNLYDKCNILFQLIGAELRKNVFCIKYYEICFEDYILSFSTLLCEIGSLLLIIIFFFTLILLYLWVYCAYVYVLL